MERVKGKRLRLLATVGACAAVALWSLVGAARMHPATAQNPPQGGCYPNNEFTMDLSGEAGPGAGPGAFSASGNFPRVSYPGGMEIENPNTVNNPDGVTIQGVNNVSLTFDEAVFGNASTDPSTPSAGSMAGKVKIVIDRGGGQFISFSGNCLQEGQVIQEDNPTLSAMEAEYEGFVTGMPGQELAPGQGGRAVASIAVNPTSDTPGLFAINIGIELGRTCGEMLFLSSNNPEVEIGLSGGLGAPQANSLYPQGYRTQGTRTAGRWAYPGSFVPFPDNFDSNCVQLGPAGIRGAQPNGTGHDAGDPGLPKPRRARPR